MHELIIDVEMVGSLCGLVYYSYISLCCESHGYIMLFIMDNMSGMDDSFDILGRHGYKGVKYR